MNGLRDQQLHFRVSKQELERIWSKMESSGILSIGSYLRKMALDGYCLRLDLPELRRIKQNLFWAFIYNIIGIPVAAGVFYLCSVNADSDPGAADSDLSCGIELWR